MDEELSGLLVTTDLKVYTRHVPVELIEASWGRDRFVRCLSGQGRNLQQRSRLELSILKVNDVFGLFTRAGRNEIICSYVV